MKLLFLYPNLQLMQIVPPGITALSSFLKVNHGDAIEIDLFDTTFYQLAERSSDERRIDTCQVRPFKFSDSGVGYVGKDPRQDFWKKVEEFKPDIVAITATDFTHNVAERIIAGIKKEFPNLFIIMGGVYPTFFPEYAIKPPDIDAICVGEGFGPLSDLFSIFEHGDRKDIEKVDNLWVKREDGSIVKNPVRAPMPINILPPDDYGLFEEKRFFRPMQGRMVKVLPMWIDLGCPYACSYCVAPTLRQKYAETGTSYFRTKSVPQIMNELDIMMEKYNPNYVYFSTETFFARPQKHIEEFAKAYAERINLPFWAETRIETITESRAAWLKQMNCDRLSVGLETGNERYRADVLKKPFSNEKFIKGIDILQNAGVQLTINNIVGMPDETREMMYETAELNRQANNGKTDISTTVSTFVPCGGTGLRQYCKDKGYFNEEEYIKMEIGSFHFGTYMNQPHITPQEVEGILRTFPLRVKLPKEFIPQITRAEQFDEEGDRTFKELRTLYWGKYFKPLPPATK